MVDLTRDEHGHVQARGAGSGAGPVRSGPVYAGWLQQQSQEFRACC